MKSALPLALLILLLLLLLFVPTRPASAASCNGNLVCETVLGEDRNSCPQDCCMRVKNGVCGFYPACANWDPDCCPGGCASSEYACSAGNTKQACSPGYCSGGACANSCSSYLQCASGYCSGGACVQNATQNGVSADGMQSCKACYSGGLCTSCSPCLSISSQGYAVYRGDAVTISYEITNVNDPPNGCTGPLSPVGLSVSGPLRKYATLSTQSFSSIANGETKRFSVTVSDIPAASYAYGAYAPGEYELKVSAISGGQQAADLSYVFVLPSVVFSSGMDIPANRAVGRSVRETPMKQGNAILPVQLEVWAW